MLKYSKSLVWSWQRVNRGFDTVDRVLRGHLSIGDRAEQGGRLSPLAITLIVILFEGCYGLVMGCFAAVDLQRDWSVQFWQMLYSAIKVPLLLLVTLLISMPSFWVINTLLGLRDDFFEAFVAIVSAQAGLAIILFSLSPLTLFIYVSLASIPSNYAIAVLVNALIFGFSSISAQRLLRRHYDGLIRRHRRHRWMLRCWIFVYAFVGIQAAYVLRPFIGNPAVEVRFFRQEPFENAYVRLGSLLWEVFRTVFDG